MQYSDIIKFWFEELTPKNWFRKDPGLDQTIRERFLTTHAQAHAGELFAWRESDEGRLAEIIVLDQFSRNLFRADARSFASDPAALILAQEAVRVGSLDRLPLPQRSFLLMPYMHSESRLIHEEADQLFHRYGMKDNIEYEALHKVIIDRFGRFPHRNAILGRPSTLEEIEFLKTPNSSF